MDANKIWDVVIVGSGPGGSSVALELVKRGKEVLIIEAGKHVQKDELGHFWPMVVWPGYYGKMAIFSRSREGTIIYHSKNVGGTSIIACGNMVRSCQAEFLERGIDLESAFQEAEIDIGVAPLPTRKVVGGTKGIMLAANKVGHQMVPMPKGMNLDKVCDLCGNCVLGCHREAKWSAKQYIDLAVRGGATLLPRTRVQCISQASELYAVDLVGKNVPRRVGARKVVLAAGGLNTPRILQVSGIKAGEGLFLDPFVVTSGLTKDRELSQEIGASMGAVVTDFHEKEGFILSPFMDHWSQWLLFTPKGRQVRKACSGSYVVSIMTKITDERAGRVNADGSISKPLTDQDKSRLAMGAGVSGDILRELGATNIVMTKQPRGAHPGGTAAVGEVVDSNLQVVGHQGLYVCDASVFPVTPGLPPILTIVALGKWLGKKLS